MIVLLAIIVFLLVLTFALSYYFRPSQKRQKDLIAKIEKIQNLPVQKWDESFLESKRRLCDPIAEEVIRNVIENHELEGVNTLMSKMMRNDELVTDGMPEVVIEYFKKTQQLPSWADQELISLGEKVYLKHGGSIAFLLMFKSLPECYSCAKGAEVLFRTGRLNEQHGTLDVFSRRIAETAQFVVNAMSPGGISSSGKGIRTAQKIRLIHASVAFYLKKRNWDSATFGEPINQEDMTGTLMSFSALILEGLDMIGVKLTPTEQEAYMHCWRVMGHMMGVDEDMLPNNVADGKALGKAIIKHQLAESEGGKVLTKALLDFTHQLAPLSVVTEASHHMLRYLVTEEVADILGVPECKGKVEEKLSHNTKALMKHLTQFENHSVVFQFLARHFTLAILNGILKHFNQGKQIQFYIPPSLQKEWLNK